ncbi:hypothetical protein CY34DRAFT_804845 [Suillus luteus UH-Slu-Lm8-n1]|uniref:Uncharacterized protein n=1 Tax=Suillus luteus UH-Slu-Lm8-n1 TaxID=930992 RepID=A0A0D0AL12_9AGAM|nr:hypothetical protein CY34DRAFT_804845 [Suillus luteus UH-Slu-Lm8-n1]
MSSTGQKLYLFVVIRNMLQRFIYDIRAILVLVSLGAGQCEALTTVESRLNFRMPVSMETVSNSLCSSSRVSDSR